MAHDDRVDIHIFFHFPPEESGHDGLSGKLDKILTQLSALGRQEIRIMASIQDVQAQADKALQAIRDESTKDDSIIVLVQQNTALITSLKEQLAAAIAANDPAALQAVLDSLTTAESTALANGQKVVDAVNANTPPA